MATSDQTLPIANAGGRFAETGVALFGHVLSDGDLVTLDAAFPKLSPRMAGARGDAFGCEFRDWLATHRGLLGLAGQLMHAPARQTRLQAFTKTATANWFVPWHQDRAEDGKERPIEVLERMIALRIHLDDCGADDGPLEVIPGSHTQARLTADAIARRVAVTQPIVCLAGRGQVLAMRPLLVHCSRRARKASGRRVLHLEYQSHL